MISTTLPLRTSLVTALDGKVIYQGKNIRVWEEYVNETTSKKIADLGTCTAYIILLNQTSNEAESTKCNRNNNDSIQIQINTVYPASKGGSKVAEEIANVVLGLLFADVKNTSLTLGNGLDLWNFELLGERNINYDGPSSRTWVKQLILEAWISQN